MDCNKEQGDRVYGCLLGAAIGDALGMPFEGASHDGIVERWDQTSFLPSGLLSTIGLRAGQFTDDTQLLLATAESIVSVNGFDAATCADYYLQCYCRGIRGVGGTTENALKRLKEGVSWRFSGAGGRNAAGNGVAMRIAPVGILRGLTKRGNLARDVKRCGFITHHNRVAIEGARIVAHLVQEIMWGLEKPKLVQIIKPSAWSPFRSAYLDLRRLLEEDVPIEGAARVLGTSGYVLHSVPLALFCFLKYDSYEDCVTNAVLAGGDTDTNAAIAGALAGCYYGAGALPDRWTRRVEGRARIQGIAEQLAAIQ